MVNIKLFKKFLFRILVLVCIVFGLIKLSALFNKNRQYIVKKWKSNFIDTFDSCPIPKYKTNTENTENYNPNDYICDKENYPVYILNDHVYISPKFQDCLYQCISHKDDFNYSLSESKVLINSSLLTCPTFVANCTENNINKRKSQVILSVQRNEDAIARSLKISNKYSKKLSDVLILGMDSMAYVTLKSLMPKTFSVLHKELNGYGFKKFNTLGDGTTVNLQGMLTGTKDTETYESRMRIRGSKPVDGYPWIWNDYKRKGYVTSFQEDTAELGTFQLRLKGFFNQPTDYYFRTAFMYAEENNYVKKFCLGNELYEKVQLDMLRKFYQIHKDVPTFVFAFLVWMSHNDNKNIRALDPYLAEFLVEQRQLYPNKLIIVYSDHGHRYFNRLSMEGKFKERLPFLGISLPVKMRKEYQNTLKRNSEILTTGMDLHATLQHFLSLETNEDPESYVDLKHRSRHKSLFLPLPLNRSCYDTELEPHWCACFKWVQANVADPDIKDVAVQIVDQISKFLSESGVKLYVQLCADLQLRKVISAQYLNADSAVLRFKGSSDIDGFVPDFSDKMKQKDKWIRMTLETMPGDAQFEVSVAIKPKRTDNNKIQIKPFGLAEVSRINRYAPWVKCLSKLNKLQDIQSSKGKNIETDIRKICICRDALK